MYAEWTLLPYLFGQVHFLYKACLVSFFLLLSCFVEISGLNANSVDPDQTPQNVWYGSSLCANVPFYGALCLNGLTECISLSLHYFFCCFRRELFKSGVTVHSIEPGGFKTAIGNAERLGNSFKHRYKNASPELSEVYGGHIANEGRKIIVKLRCTLYLRQVFGQRVICIVHCIYSECTDIWSESTVSVAPPVIFGHTNR